MTLLFVREEAAGIFRRPKAPMAREPSARLAGTGG